MQISVRQDVMRTLGKMKFKGLAKEIRITPQNLSLLKVDKIKAVRFETLARICGSLCCQPRDILEAVPDNAPPE